MIIDKFGNLDLFPGEPLKYQFHTGNREHSGLHLGRRGDCVARALSIITEKPYIEIWQMLATIHPKKTADKGIFTDISNYKGASFKKLAESLGFKFIKCDAKLQLKNLKAINGKDIIWIRKHFIARINDTIFDTHISKPNTLVKGYWIYKN